MSDTTNVNQTVEELSKAGNEAELEKALADGFNELSADGETAGGDKPQKTNANPSETPPAEGKPETGEPLKEDGADPKPGQEANEGKDRYQKILADRNAAQEQAANQQTENQILSKQVKDLTDLVQKLADGQSATGDEGDPLSADEPKGNLEDVINKILDKRDERSNSQQAAEKSIADGIKELEGNPETPDANQHADKVAEVMRKHPTLTAFAAYKLAQSVGTIPTEFSSNANRTGTGNRSKSNLRQTKSAENMSAEEQEKYLRDAQASGDLVI